MSESGGATNAADHVLSYSNSFSYTSSCSQNDVDQISQELFGVMIDDEVVQEISQEIAAESVRRTKGPPKRPGRRTRRRRSTASLDSYRSSIQSTSSDTVDTASANDGHVTAVERNSVSDTPYAATAWICLRYKKDAIQSSYIGAMNISCKHCSASMFHKERAKRTKENEFILCCHKGKVSVPSENNYPPFLKTYLTDNNHPDFQHVRRNIRAYNNCLSFASMGVKVVHEEERPSGDFFLKLHGQMYHRTFHGNDSSTTAKYSQLYFVDPAEANLQRLQHPANMELRKTVLDEIEAYLRENNPFAKIYQSLREKSEVFLGRTGLDEIPNLRIEFRRHAGVHPGRGNIPTSNDIAAIFDTPNGLPPKEIDFVVYPKAPVGRNQHEDRSISISRLSANLEPMTFILFYPNGGQGWSPTLIGNGRSGRNARVSQMEYYSSKLVLRLDVFNPILHGGKLMQQYVLFAWLHTEGNRLNYLRYHQTELRVDSYQGLADYLNCRADELGAIPGSRVILPSTFVGSERYLRELYYDCMAIVGSVGRPDFFITFTCNPAWPEIQENLFPGQRPCDQPMLVNRVFHLKLEEFLNDIVKLSMFGKVAGYILSIEFQKRGLPHAHMLIIMHHDYKITEAEDVDKFVRAEFPDPIDEPELYEIVVKSMLHGPCGTIFPDAACMNKGSCSKGYPKEYCEDTFIGEKGFPRYRRRPGYEVTLMRHGQPVTYDNRWIVPYNPFCSKKFNCHINVEICASLNSIKYVNKYILKGHDCTSITVTEGADGQRVANIDEIKNYCEGRYVSAPEAAYRLAGFPMHKKSHVVQRVGVHEENLQSVYFHEGQIDRALERAIQKKTQLQAWFELNSDPVLGGEARKYLYKEIPIHYTFKDGKWKPRTPNGWKIAVRLYNVSPKDVNLFHLRLLTLYVPGARSFEELKMYEGIRYDTYREACIARGLLQTDEEWEKCLDEGRLFFMPFQLRQTFAFICVFNNPGNSEQLWQKFKHHLSEDFLRTDNEVVAYAKALNDINKTLRVHGYDTTHFGLPPTVDVAELEATMSVEEMLHEAETMISTFGTEQLAVFHAINDALANPNPEGPSCIYIDGAGGTGKTFCLNAIIRHCNAKGRKVSVFATTGIAAELLDSGRTLHSGFRLPLDMHDGIKANISKRTAAAKKLIDAELIIIDEATMMNIHALKAVSECLADLCESSHPFGNKVIVLAGDWRQTLPIVERASKKVILENCITSNTELWALFRRFTLKVNMRAAGHPTFCEWLLTVGDGTIQSGPEFDIADELMEIPKEMIIPVDQLMTMVYGDRIQSHDLNYLAETVIVTPLNSDSAELNKQAMALLPAAEQVYYSADSVQEEDQRVVYPPEFLHTLKPSGMPPHALCLKEGLIVMLMRNLQIERGLLNGTRMMIQHLRPNVIVCVVIRGKRQGQVVMVPRISMGSNSRLPFTLVRRQFPLMPAYAMTINKSQGQSFSRVGIWLPRPVFSHGHLYVALSRTRDPNKLWISVAKRGNQGDLFNSGDIFTLNVVWPEVFLQVNRCGIRHNASPTEEGRSPMAQRKRVASAIRHEGPPSAKTIRT